MRLKQTSARKQEWTSVGKPGFIVAEPNGPWFECTICEVSDREICLDVGHVKVPNLFMLMLTANSKVRRACLVQWRSGHLLRAKFLSAREIRRRATQAQLVE
jgi:hypothetical protein